MLDINGNPLSMATDFGTVGYGTLEPGNGTLEEQISFSGLVNNGDGTTTLTGVNSVSFVYPYTETSGLSKTHAGASTFVISNTSGFYNKFIAKDDDGAVSETITFTEPNFPQMDGVLDSPTLPAQLTTKAYVDATVIAGAPNASTSVKGLVQLATQAQVDAKTLVGSTSAYLVTPLNAQRSTLLSDYVLDTSPSANIITIAPSPAISSYAAGQQFSFRVLNTNTSAVVTLNVNGVGAKNMVKLNGATSPAVGDVNAGQVISVEYDGTNFQILTPVANAPATLSYVNSNFVKFGGTGADGALTATSGTTTIALGAAPFVVKNYTSISLTASAVLAFSGAYANGTVVILKSQGNVTITSTASPAVDLRSIGGGTGMPFGFSNGNNGGGGSTGVGGTGGSGASVSFMYINSNVDGTRGVVVQTGSNGGTGGSGQATGAGGAGGVGGGALYIECAGALNVTSVFNASGSAGTNGNSTGAGGTASNAGGGGGGGGSIVILYNSLTANSGTYTVSGGVAGTEGSTGNTNGGGGGAGGGCGAGNGAGGNGASGQSAGPGSGTSGNGGSGFSYIGQNTYFS